jgi:hypothetical protein
MKRLFTYKLLFFLLTFLSLLNLQAQDYPNLSIGISAMADYRFKINKATNFNVGRYAFGSTVGMEIKIDWTKRIGLVTGIYNDDCGFKTWPKDSGVILGYHQGTFYYTYTSYHFFNLNIPIMVKYKLISKPRIFWDIGAGISANCFYLDKYFHYYREFTDFTWHGSIENSCPSKIRTLNLSSKFSTSINYKIKLMTLGFELGYYLAILDDNYHNYYYGIGAGFSVMFDLERKTKKK